MPIYVSVFIPVLDLALIKTRWKSCYWVKIGGDKVHIFTQIFTTREFTYDIKRMWSNTSVFRLLSFRYYKLGNWVWSQETHRVHLGAILLILIFSWWFTYYKLLYFKLGNWVWSQETHRVHLRAILLILILVGGLLIKEAALRFFRIILFHRWSCLLMLNKPTHTRISWVLYYKLF